MVSHYVNNYSPILYLYKFRVTYICGYILYICISFIDEMLHIIRTTPRLTSWLRLFMQAKGFTKPKDFLENKARWNNHVSHVYLLRSYCP